MTNRNLAAEARAALEGRGEINDFDRRAQPDHVESLIERLRLAYGGELSRECAATFRALLARVEELEAELDKYRAKMDRLLGLDDDHYHD